MNAIANGAERHVWDAITHQLQTLPQTSAIPKYLFLHLQKNFLPKVLNIKIQQHRVIFNNTILDLKTRQKVFKIFSLFMSSYASRLSRDTLVEHIYLERGRTDISPRQKDCYNHNIVKLVSRARQIAQTSFQDSVDVTLDWFPYDPCTQTWKLYSIREA